MGHTGGLINPHPWHGRCQAGYSNTGAPPLPRKRVPCQKKSQPGHRSSLATFSSSSMKINYYLEENDA